MLGGSFIGPVPLRNRLARHLGSRATSALLHSSVHRGVIPLLVNRVAKTQPSRVSFRPLYPREIAQWRFGGLLANESYPGHLTSIPADRDGFSFESHRPDSAAQCFSNACTQHARKCAADCPGGGTFFIFTAAPRRKSFDRKAAWSICRLVGAKSVSSRVISF